MVLRLKLDVMEVRRELAVWKTNRPSILKPPFGHTAKKQTKKTKQESQQENIKLHATLEGQS